MPEDASPTRSAPPTIKSALRDATHALKAHSESPRVDAGVLLGDCLGLDHAALIAHDDRPIDPVQHSRFLTACTRRLAGEPIAYIIGKRGFWTLELEVNQATLIPRPDTETLVEQALTRLPTDRDLRVLDLGTGSGAIAIAIATERPRCHVTATDISHDALTVARRNATSASAAVRFIEGDWFDALGAHTASTEALFDVIVSNPPYIARADHHLASGDLRFEPQSALVSGDDGLDAIRMLIREAQAWLKPAGWLLLEHGYDQATSVESLFSHCHYQSITTTTDLGGNPRVGAGQKAG